MASILIPTTTPTTVPAATIPSVTYNGYRLKSFSITAPTPGKPVNVACTLHKSVQNADGSYTDSPVDGDVGVTLTDFWDYVGANKGNVPVSAAVVTALENAMGAIISAIEQFGAITGQLK